MAWQRRIGLIGCGGEGGGATAVGWWRRNCFTIRSWRMEVEDGLGCIHLVSWRGNPTLTNLLGGDWAGFMVGLGLGSFFGVSYLVIPTQLLPQFHHKSYLKALEIIGLTCLT
jgi:hypothetical protein